MRQTSGEGFGTCYGCEQKDKWNYMWMCFLHYVDNDEHLYCYDCAKEIEEKEVK